MLCKVHLGTLEKSECKSYFSKKWLKTWNFIPKTIDNIKTYLLNLICYKTSTFWKLFLNFWTQKPWPLPSFFGGRNCLWAHFPASLWSDAVCRALFAGCEKIKNKFWEIFCENFQRHTVLLTNLVLILYSIHIDIFIKNLAIF